MKASIALVWHNRGLTMSVDGSLGIVLYSLSFKGPPHPPHCHSPHFKKFLLGSAYRKVDITNKKKKLCIQTYGKQSMICTIPVCMHMALRISRFVLKFGDPVSDSRLHNIWVLTLSYQKHPLSSTCLMNKIQLLTQPDITPYRAHVHKRY